MRDCKHKEIIMVLIVYLGIRIVVMANDARLFNHILNPLFWIGFPLYLLWNPQKYNVRYRMNRKDFTYIFFLGCVNMLIFFCLGFVWGFCKSPYSHKLIGILKNIWIQLLPCISMEVIRGIMVSRNKKHPRALVGITMLCILLEINYSTVIDLFYNKEELFKYTCSTILPMMAYSILYTYLTFHSCYLLPLTYRLFKDGSILLLPILPDINWFVSGSIGVLLPTIMYGIFQHRWSKKHQDIRKKQESVFTKISYGITILVCIILICFMLGAFQYEPISILSNSMEPTFRRGDVVIFKKRSDNQLKEIPENAIIIYSIGEQNIAHRVIHRIEKEGSILYQTKGDSNHAPDGNFIEPHQIKGIYVFHIKYLGFPSVWLYEYFRKEEAKVEIQ